jgi:hypothetical protein
LPLFDRVVTVEVGPPGQEGFLAEDFRVAFEVAKSLTPQPNPISVSVWNLKKENRDRIDRTTDRVILRAGYTEDVGAVLLAIGDIVDVVHRSEAPDVITEIIAGDGSGTMRTFKQSMTFSEGASAKAALAQLAQDSGVVLRDVTELIDSEFANGFAESGPFSELLDKIVGKLGAEWSIQNGELQVTEIDKPTNDVALALSPDSGLIGAPERRTDQGTPRSPSQKDGWVINALLQPSVEPGSRIVIRSNVVEGTFRVKELRHVGDTHTDSFTTTMVIEGI